MAASYSTYAPRTRRRQNLQERTVTRKLPGGETETVRTLESKLTQPGANVSALEGMKDLGVPANPVTGLTGEQDWNAFFNQPQFSASRAVRNNLTLAPEAPQPAETVANYMDFPQQTAAAPWIANAADNYLHGALGAATRAVAGMGLQAPPAPPQVSAVLSRLNDPFRQYQALQNVPTFGPQNWPSGAQPPANAARGVLIPPEYSPGGKTDNIGYITSGTIT